MQPPNPQAQFENWWRPNEDRFRAYARRRAGGDQEVAADATQEAGRYIWGRWADYQPGPDDSIVFTILRSRVIDQLRRRARLTFTGAELETPSREDPPEEGLALQEALRDEQECVDALPDTPAEPMRAVHLLHQASRNDRQVAAELGIPYSRARRLRRQGNVAVHTCLIRRICHEDQQFLAVLQECIDTLPEQQPQVFQMHWSDQPIGTIAGQIGAQEDRTLSLLEDAAERVLRCLIGRIYGS